jgi:parallel beta-helix repeat protein
VSVSEAKNMIESNPLLVVLDVRAQGEYDDGHIRNAKLIPHTQLEARIDELDENRDILVYCRSGYRSALASKILVNHSFQKVYNMLGGILAWTAEDYPVYVHYGLIQQAINNASEGATIFISSGTYYENVVVNKTVSLIGENNSNTIIDGNFTGNVVQIEANNVTITSFIIQNSGGNWSTPQYGIHIFSDNNEISYNKITNNFDGICLYYSSLNTVSRNNIIDNHEHGIELYYYSDNNTLSGNYLTANNGGIYLNNSSNNIIIRNCVTDNHEHGIELLSSPNNSLYHNNLINNTKQVHIGTSGYTNFWDDGLEGNYWSNYTGVDLDHDGIGDGWHEIDQNNTDNHPLMGVFHSFNISLGYHLNVISNSTIEDFVYFASNNTIKMHVYNISIQHYGFCRVCIPHTLMNPDKISVVIDNGQTQVLHHNYTLHDSSTHRWIYFAYEHSTRKVVIYEDNTSPIISVLSPENRTYAVNDIPLNFTVSELTSWIGYSLDSADNATIGGNVTLEDLPEGSHYMVVYANDTVGNMGASDTVYFTIDTTAPNITDVSQTPETVLPEDIVQVNANVTDNLSGIKQVTLNYTNGNGTWITVEMSNVAGDVWNGNIPAFPYCTNVTYIIMAEDNAGNTITTEQMELEYQYHVIPEFQLWTILPLLMITTLLVVVFYEICPTLHIRSNNLPFHCRLHSTPNPKKW